MWSFFKYHKLNANLPQIETDGAKAVKFVQFIVSLVFGVVDLGMHPDALNR